MLFIFEYVDVLMYVPIVYGFLPEINVFVFEFVIVWPSRSHYKVIVTSA